MAFCVMLLLPAAACVADTRDFARLRDGWRSSYAYLLDRDGVVVQGQRLDFQALRLSWVRLEDVSPAFLRALVAIEDQRFETHHGIDWRALIAALWQNLTSDRRRGASTLTMQTRESARRSACGARRTARCVRQMGADARGATP